MPADTGTSWLIELNIYNKRYFISLSWKVTLNKSSNMLKFSSVEKDTVPNVCKNRQPLNVYHI